MCRIVLVVIVILSMVCVQDNVNANDILESPYMAAILFQEWQTSVYRYRCNGVIISIRHVLTTATCAGNDFSFGDLKVRVGSSFHNRGGQIHSVVDKRKHFKFSPDLDADIAVLTLSEPLKLSYRVSVANLPEQDATIDGSWDKAKFRFYIDDKWSGATISDSLGLITGLQFITTDECNSLFGNDLPFEKLVTENMICVNIVSGKVLINYLSSLRPLGAPLLFNETVYGIFSWDQTNSNSPSVFTRVSAFSKWIKNW